MWLVSATSQPVALERMQCSLARLHLLPSSAMCNFARAHYATPHRTTPQNTTPRHATSRRTTPRNTTPHHTTPHHTTPHHTTPHHTTPHHTTPHHTTPHHTTPHPEYSPALPMGWVPGAKPRMTGPGRHPMGGVLTVSGVRTPPCQTPPSRSPRPPSTGCQGSGKGQRPLERTADPASPSSPLARPPCTQGPQRSSGTRLPRAERPHATCHRPCAPAGAPTLPVTPLPCPSAPPPTSSLAASSVEAPTLTWGDAAGPERVCGVCEWVREGKSVDTVRRNGRTCCRVAAKMPPTTGEGSPQPPGMGGVAPLVERFEATPPLRAHHLVPDFVWVHRNVFAGFQEYFNFAQPLWAPVRLDTLVKVSNIL